MLSGRPNLGSGRWFDPNKPAEPNRTEPTFHRAEHVRYILASETKIRGFSWPIELVALQLICNEVLCFAPTPPSPLSQQRELASF
jgi:hypothetical protein